MPRVFLHPFAGVLSAYGMGLADVRALRERQVEAPFDDKAPAAMEDAYGELLADAEKEVLDQVVHLQRVTRVRQAQLRDEGTDSPLPVDYGSLEEMPAALGAGRSQEKRRVGRECGRQGRCRWATECE